MRKNKQTLEDSTAREGHKYTIRGVRQRKDGTFTFRCKPGNETQFTSLEVNIKEVNIEGKIS